MSTPPRHARHGLYLPSRGLADKHVGQIGRVQHGVRKMSRALGGKEDEQARHKCIEETNYSTATKA